MATANDVDISSWFIQSSSPIRDGNYPTSARVGAADPAFTTIDANPVSVDADGVTTSTITVQARDSNDVALTTGGDTVTLSENGDAVISAVTDNNDGTYTATVTDSTVELITVTGTINAQSITDTASVDFVGATSATLTSLQFTPTNIVEANALANGANSPLLTADNNTIATDVIGSASDYGTKCFQMSILQGQYGFGDWGCVFNLPSVLGKGDSVHVQFSTYMPTAFDWTAPSEGGHLKYLRIHTQSSVGSNEGYNDIYISNGTTEPGRDGYLKHIDEIIASWTLLPDFLTKNQWETFEMRVDFDDVPVDSGGTGRTRIWQNQNGVMTLILDKTDDRTLNTATSQSDRVHIFTYWNGASPQDNLCYMDRLVVETNLGNLVETDAGGTPIIGGIL